MPSAVRVGQHRVRYLETDAQGIAFNMWYLGWCDEAYADYLEALGLDYDVLLARGYDVHVVHAELDWSSALRARDLADLSVTCEGVGTTSFTVRTDITCEGRAVASVRVVYVGVDVSGPPVPVPADLRERLLD